jgi:hypothetical protein
MARQTRNRAASREVALRGAERGLGDALFHDLDHAVRQARLVA